MSTGPEGLSDFAANLILMMKSQLDATMSKVAALEAKVSHLEKDIDELRSRRIAGRPD